MLPCCLEDYLEQYQSRLPLYQQVSKHILVLEEGDASAEYWAAQQESFD